VFGDLGTWSKTDAEFRIHNGPTIYFRTGKDPDSIVGITNIRAVWGDEAGKFSLYFWENIQARASFKDAPILLTTSPYTLNWIYKDLIKPYKAGKFRPSDVMLIQASSNENPYFPEAVFRRKKDTMDPRRFQMIYGGEWGKMSGLVYGCFDDAANMVSKDKLVLPPGTRYFGGIDWGFTEPFVLTVRAITPTGQHFQVSEHYKSGLTINDIIPVCAQQATIWGIETFYCGPDQPGSILELNRYFTKAKIRSSAVAAENDVRRGLDVHYELIRTGRYKIVEGTSPMTIDELETYHYPEPEDLGPDDKARDQLPVQQNDHALDSCRYLSIMTARLTEKIRPQAPEAIKKKITIEEHLKRLKRLPGKNPGSENWS